jgi:hypothetical protein
MITERSGPEAAQLMMALLHEPESEQKHRMSNQLFHPGMQVADIVPGIIHQNDCSEWIHDEISNGHDVDWDSHAKVCEGIKENGQCDCDYSQGDTLLGDWKRVYVYRLGRREVPKGTPGSKRGFTQVEDKKGKDGFSAYWYGGDYGSLTIRVSWSKWIYCNADWCSPCYPGQASIGKLGSDGVSAYVLPPELSRCYDCQDVERPVVHAVDYDGAMLCDVCCEKYGIDYKTGGWK